MGGAMLNGERVSRQQAEEIVGKFISRYLPDNSEYIICGSYRRKKEDMGDIDLVVVINPKDQMAFGIRLQKEFNVPWSYVKKPVKIDGVQLEVNLCLDVNYLGAMVLYATGSGGFNARMRLVAAEKGLKLNRYGLWKRDVRIAGATEEGIFKCLGLKYVDPQDRR